MRVLSIAGIAAFLAAVIECAPETIDNSDDVLFAPTEENSRRRLFVGPRGIIKFNGNSSSQGDKATDSSKPAGFFEKMLEALNGAADRERNAGSSKGGDLLSKRKPHNAASHHVASKSHLNLWLGGLNSMADLEDITGFNKALGIPLSTKLNYLADLEKSNSNADVFPAALKTDKWSEDFLQWLADFDAAVKYAIKHPHSPESHAFSAAMI